MADPIHLTLTVNGAERSVDALPFARLLDVLRDQLGLTGTKEGCGEGECGACSVLLNGRVVNSCLVPAGQLHGAEVVTVEGLALDGALSPVQAAFLNHNAAQCGFCTPGMLVAATVVAYLPVWWAGFIWDDDTFLLNNPLIQRPDGLFRLWFTTAAPDYFPLTSNEQADINR